MSREHDRQESTEEEQKRIFGGNSGVEMGGVEGNLQYVTGVTASEWDSLRQFSELDFEDGSAISEVKKKGTEININFSNKGANFLVFFSLTAPGRKWSIPFFFRCGEFRVRAHTSELYILAAQGMEMSL